MTDLVAPIQSARNLVDRIGNTPVVELSRLSPNPRVRIFAKQVAERIEHGTIAVVFPDGGEKYMSTPLFDLPVGSMLDETL